MLEILQARLGGVRHWLDWLARWGSLWEFGCGKGVAMDERMSRGTSLDLSQADQITTLEVAIAVLELPQWSVWGSSVEDIAHWGFTSSVCGEQ